MAENRKTHGTNIMEENKMEAIEWDIMLCRSMTAKNGEHELEFEACNGNTDTYRCKNCRGTVDQYTDGCGG